MFKKKKPQPAPVEPTVTWHTILVHYNVNGLPTLETRSIEGRVVQFIPRTASLIVNHETTVVIVYGRNVDDQDDDPDNYLYYPRWLRTFSAEDDMPEWVERIFRTQVMR